MLASAPPTPPRRNSASMVNQSPNATAIPGSSTSARPVASSPGSSVPFWLITKSATRSPSRARSLACCNSSGCGEKWLTVSNTTMAMVYSSGVSTSVSGIPMMNAANAHNADMRHVARRLRFCTLKKVSGLSGPKLRLAVGSALFMRA
ncbi:MAG TPA: hypothetical protein VF938_08185 [Candidatus Angelobacter sp.]